MSVKQGDTGSSPVLPAKFKTMKYDLKELTDYFDKNGVNFTVDLNPSPEKIKSIEEYLGRKTKLEKLMKKEFDNL